MSAASLSLRLYDAGYAVDSRLAAPANAGRTATPEAAGIADVARGDRRAFEALYREYAPRIFRFAFRLIRDRAKAEEVVNDVMLEVWKNAGHFEGRSSLSTWILGIARHRTLNAVRGKTLYLTPLDDAVDVVDESPAVESGLDQKILALRLREALDRLSPEHREVIELTFMEEKSYKEIAEIAQCPENTIKTRMFHAKKKLGPLLAALADAGDTP